jgi:CDP-glycerol glycerophosphotransferase
MLTKLIKPMVKTVSSAVTFWIALLSRDKNIYIFTAKHGYTDNTKYLFEHYIKKGKKCVWIASSVLTKAEVSRATESHSNASVVTKKNIKLIFYFAKAKYIFVTHSLNDCGPLSSKTATVVNLWHGIPFKKMGYDSSHDVNALDLLTSNPYVNNDYVICSSLYTQEIFESCMRISPDHILPLGQPRVDFLLSNRDENTVKERLRAVYTEDPKVKVTLYAPTFRDQQGVATQIYLNLISGFSKNATKNEVLVLRLHPNERHLLHSFNLPANVALSVYDDVQRDLLASDRLISDYSSVIFDYAVLNRPILRYAPDQEGYLEKREGCYATCEIFDFCFEIRDDNMEAIFVADALLSSSVMHLHSENACEAIFNRFR